MYRRPKFLDALLEIRREMAREADHDVAAYVELVRSREEETPRSAAEPAGTCSLEQPAERSESVLEGSSQAAR